MLGNDEMAYLKTEDSFEKVIREMVTGRALELWRNEMRIAIANGIVTAFGGDK